MDDDRNTQRAWRKVKTFSFTAEDEHRLERLLERTERQNGTQLTYSQIVRAALVLMEESEKGNIQSALLKTPQPRFGFEPKEKSPKYELTEKEHQKMLEETGLADFGFSLSKVPKK